MGREMFIFMYLHTFGTRPRMRMGRCWYFLVNSKLNSVQQFRTLKELFHLIQTGIHVFANKNSSFSLGSNTESNPWCICVYQFEINSNYETHSNICFYPYAFFFLFYFFILKQNMNFVIQRFSSNFVKQEFFGFKS